MKKLEFLVMLMSMVDILLLIQVGVIVFLVGEQRYGLRLVGEFFCEDVIKVVEIVYKEGVKVYVVVNVIFYNDKVGEFGEYLVFLVEIGVDVVVFGDFVVFMVVCEFVFDLKFYWSIEMIGINYYICNYWG